MSENLFVCYSQNQSTKIIPFAHIVKKDKQTYRMIEDNFFSEIRYYNNYVRYQTTEIPNKFKFENAPKRIMMITTITCRDKASIIDVFPDLKDKDKTSHLWIHAINRPFSIYLSGTSAPVFLEKHTTLEIVNSDGREKKILFQCVKDTALIAVEVLNIEKPATRFAQNEPNWTYNVNENDIKSEKSFVRLSMSPNQEDLITVFASFRYVRLKNGLAPCVVAATVLNFEGKLLLNSIITPREPVKHYHQHNHGLSELQIRGNWDSEDFGQKIKVLLDSRIVVGMHIQEFVTAVSFPTTRLMGIRDLSNALCLDDTLIKSHGTYTLKYLEDQIADRSGIKATDLVTEAEARSIRNIYLKIRSIWKDHIQPESRNNNLRSEVQIPVFKNFIIQRNVEDTEEELGPPPRITLQDEDEELKANEMEYNFSDTEIPSEDISMNEQLGNEQDILDKQQTIEVQQEGTTAGLYPDLEVILTRIDQSTIPTEELYIKQEVVEGAISEDQFREIQGIPPQKQQALKRHKDVTLASNCTDLDDASERLYFENPEKIRWKNRILQYDGKKVEKTILFNKGEPSTEDIAIFNKRKCILSSKVFVDPETGTPNVHSFRYGVPKSGELTIEEAQLEIEQTLQNSRYRDPNRWRKPDAKFKLPCQFYSGKRVEQCALLDSNLEDNRLEVSGQSFILSSLIYVNEQTGEPLVVTQRFKSKKSKLVEELVNEKDEPKKKKSFIYKLKKKKKSQSDPSPTA